MAPLPLWRLTLHFGDTFSAGPLQNSDVCPCLYCWCGACGAARSQRAIFRELADPTALFKENFSDDSSRGESGDINSAFESAIDSETGNNQTTSIQKPFGSEITESADADGGSHWPSVAELLSSVSLFSTNLTAPTQEADETRLGNLRQTGVSDHSHLTNETAEIQEGGNLPGLSDVGEIALRATASEAKFGKDSTSSTLLSITHLSESTALPDPDSFKSIENSNTSSTIVSSRSSRTKRFRRSQDSTLDSTSEFDLRGSEDTTFESTATKSTLIQDPTDCSVEVAGDATSTDERSIGESRPRSDSEPVNGNPAKDLTNICETVSTLAKTNEGHQWPADGADLVDSPEVNASNAGDVMTTDKPISDFTDNSWISEFLESYLNEATKEESISELTEESVISQETLAGPSLIEASASVCCDLCSSHFHETGVCLHGSSDATTTPLSTSKPDYVAVSAPPANPIEFPRSVLKSFIDVSNSAHLVTDSNQLNHTGEKPYKCSQCEKSFSKSCHLKTHHLIHTGEKPFKCGQCEKSFAQPSHLKVHERTHTGEKPFRCGQCEASFSQRSSLKTHERTHTGEKPFKCGQCEASFSQRSSLKTHERTHTGEKPFKCGQCEKSFAQSSNMKAHHKATHTV